MGMASEDSHEQALARSKAEQRHGGDNRLLELYPDFSGEWHEGFLLDGSMDQWQMCQRLCTYGGEGSQYEEEEHKKSI
jgi:lysine/ornithine N-monooxygenase